MTQRQKIRAARIACLSFLLLPSCGEARHEEVSTVQPEALLSCRDATQPSFLEKKITTNFEKVLFPQVIDYLNTKLRLPVSFIEDPEAVRIELRVKDESVRAFLERLVGQSQGYRCSVIEGHVVIYREALALHEIVGGVSITEELRGRAAQSYVKIVSGRLTDFKDLVVVLGGLLDSAVFTDKITLAREATVLRHLCQLLGKNPGVFFRLGYATGGRYLNFGSAF